MSVRQKSFFRSLKALGLSDNEYKQLYDEFSRYKTPTSGDVRYVFEISWEAANKVGGIYTVIRSKAGGTVEELGDRYVLIGPYNEACVKMEVEVCDNLPDPYREPIERMRARGIRVVTGRWLIEGYPQLILFRVGEANNYLSDWRTELWNNCHIGVPWEDVEVNDTVLFGGLVSWFLGEFASCNGEAITIAHFHEWLAGVGLLFIRTRKIPVCTIFTTHATLLGRHLCAGSTDFYNNLSRFSLDKEAGTRGFYHRYCIERGAAHLAHVFTTVSQITALEAEHLLGRKPDVITPNGLSVENFKAPHEFQNLHAKAKDKINDFVRGHFHGHYDFDFDKTLYFFIAGRYEFSNKGADMFIESLARLNHRLQVTQSDKTIVAFLIFPTKTNNFNVETLRGQAIARQLRETINQVQANIGKRLFERCLRGEMPDSKDLLAQEDVVNMKRCILTAQRTTLPPVCTHNVVDDLVDPVLCAIRRCNLLNRRSDRVKVIFHPEFITSSNPLFGLDYNDFVRGTNLGVFPSYYEPWGYTPAECTVMGVPSITTNLSGFGCYMQDAIKHTKDYGIYIVDRRFCSPDDSVNILTEFMFEFANQTQRERINQRNRTERLSELLNWRLLGMHYQKARALAVERVYPELAVKPDHEANISDWNFVSGSQFPRPRSVASQDQSRDRDLSHLGGTAGSEEGEAAKAGESEESDLESEGSDIVAPKEEASK